MAETGASYQQALARLRNQKRESTKHAPPDVDLLCVDYFGTRVTLATFQILERFACVVVPSSRQRPAASASQRSPFSALSARRSVA